MKYLLDTHTWIWWHMRPEALSPQALQIIQGGKYDSLLLSAISVWEFSKLLEKRRLTIACDGRDWIEKAIQIPKLRVVELSPEIAWQSTRLPSPFHDDPADQIIVATARSEDATLLTADRPLRAYPHVRTEW
jgi:PIN domain nuclease of toxin-antitoxin system